MGVIEFKNVSYLWDKAKAAELEGDEVALLIYRSNLLGADLRLTNYGGGNTSCKAMAKDPLTGVEKEVMWVKGSGGDIGVHPFYDAVFHQVINGYSHYNITGGTTSYTPQVDNGTIKTRNRVNGYDNNRYWTSFVNNTLMAMGIVKEPLALLNNAFAVYLVMFYCYLHFPYYMY